MDVPGEGEGAQPAGGRTAAAVLRLERAVDRLEQAVDAHEQRLPDEGDRSSGMRAETEALRSLQHLLSDRLDAAIARLKSGVGD